MTERYRIYAAVFLAVFVIGGGGFLVMGRGSGSPAAAHVVKPLHPVRKSKAKVAVTPPKLRAGKKMSAAPKKRPAGGSKPAPTRGRRPRAAAKRSAAGTSAAETTAPTGPTV